MKKFILINLGVLLFTLSVVANNYSFLPYTITQPDGEKISCFVSGDEFFNWIHDKDGYTIIQAPDGYFYYGEVSGDFVVPTKYKVNSVNPADVGLKKWAKISTRQYAKNRAFMADTKGVPTKAPHTGTLNNIVVYIRFSDDTEFTDTRQTFDDKFNLATAVSLKSYFTDVSYGLFTVSSTHYPAVAMNTNLSYQDSHPRSYFQPYNATTNTNGYTGGDNGSMRTLREHTLLRDAINWINTNSPVSAGLNIDGDGDGFVDNICFNVRGTYGGWATLLWAHSWSLYTYSVTINGKRVYKYTFQPEPQINIQTLCHEMFHAVGSPDLYHYSYDGLQPVQGWDLMESGFGHMGAYMKWKYAAQTWITSIPEITTSGTYTLNPLTSSTNNCYKIASANSATQFYIVEFRKKSGTYEGNIPGSGLLVYRIDQGYTGNASGPPDEVYIYRPSGTISANGSPSSAFYSSESGRTSINDGTSPSGFLQNGSAGGLNISNVTSSAGSTISFTVTFNSVVNPTNFTAIPASMSQIDLQWQKNASNENVMLAYSTSSTFGTPVNGTAYAAGSTITGGGTVLYAGGNSTFNHTGLPTATTYYYKLWSVASGNNYSVGITQTASTLCEVISAFPWNETFENGGASPNCWTQEQISSSGINWTFITGNGGSYPGTAHGGTYNACLLDVTSGDNKTRLVTPTLDLSSLSSPTLTFWHTQTIWAADQDILTVYYKTSAGGEWVQLATYTSSITSWTQETISLPNTSSSYYISFEGNAKYGYGVCLDDVQVSGVSTRTVTLSSVMLQGLYNGGGTMRQAQGAGWPAGVADHITVELHSGVAGNYGTIVYAATEVPLSTSGTATLVVPGTYGSNYYITVKHRNSIETTTASAVSFAGSAISQSFGSRSYVYGNNLVQMSDGTYAIYSGNANTDGNIDLSDLVLVGNKAATASSGYLPEDINGDGMVDLTDLILVGNSAAMAIGAILP